MPPNPQIISVTQLNRQIRNWLEQEIGEVCVEGEVSTLSKPASGHYYFTLKDATAQIRCVFFRNRKNNDTETILQAGNQILATGHLSLYEARGDYQLIVENIKAAGQGDLYRQFELLKIKLAELGLFDTKRKKALPRFPKTIGVVTSSSGAALRDILTTLSRRYPIADVLVYPSEVQGAQAPQQLIAAIQRANNDNRCDVLILARGGGSIEDLWGFNNEQLAYAIANSALPIVSGVGHETDFTIADFVADLRAATPTAAAEAVSPNQLELIGLLNTLELRLTNAIKRFIQHQQLLLRHELQKIASPGQLIRSHWQSLDYLSSHLSIAVLQQIAQKKHRLQMLLTKLHALNPTHQIYQNQQRIHYLTTQITQSMARALKQQQSRLETQLATLHAVSPLATLSRGYAIATHKNHVLLNSQETKIGDTINVRLASGNLICEVKEHA